MSGVWPLAATGCFFIGTLFFIICLLCWAGGFVLLAFGHRKVSKMEQGARLRSPILTRVLGRFWTVQNGVQNGNPNAAISPALRGLGTQSDSGPSSSSP